MRLDEADVDAIVIPTNWCLNSRGHAIMGAGVARQAKQRWPDLPARLGRLMVTATTHTHPCVGLFAVGPNLTERVITFPTKHDWRKPADIDLIRRCLPELVSIADSCPSWTTVALPRLGCGLGQLDWVVQVRPLLADLLDDRFVVVNR